MAKTTRRTTTGDPDEATTGKKPSAKRGSGAKGRKKTSKKAGSAAKITKSKVSRQEAPAVGASAEVMTFGAALDRLAANAAACGKPATRVRTVGDRKMICFLQSDCTYGECRPYDG